MKNKLFKFKQQSDHHWVYDPNNNNFIYHYNYYYTDRNYKIRLINGNNFGITLKIN